MNYNTCAIAGLWEHPDAWGEPKLRWIPCEWPILGVLRETSKAKLIQLDSKTACHNDKREWHAFVGDTYVGQAVDDVLGTYWFDDKPINFQAISVLDANEVPFRRG